MTTPEIKIRRSYMVDLRDTRFISELDQDLQTSVQFAINNLLSLLRNFLQKLDATDPMQMPE